MKKPKLVMVEWQDAFSNSAWHQEEEIDEEFLKGSPWKCVNVGYLIRDEPEYVVVASRAAFSNQSFGHLQRIPRGMVQRVRILRDPS